MSAKQGATDLVEPVYKTEYCSRALPDEWLQQWQRKAGCEALHLPHLNPFIPSDFDLLQACPPSTSAAAKRLPVT